MYKRLFSENTVELKSEVIELAIGDESKSLAAKLDVISRNLNKELDNAFTPIREIAKLANSIPSSINGLKEFTDALGRLETQYSEDKKRIKDIEKELGISVPQNKSMDEALKTLQHMQSNEATFRKEINEFNSLVKKYK